MEKRKKTIMILNGENRGCLGLTRALGKEGHTIIIGGSKLLSRSGFSKFCSKRFQYPPLSKGHKKMHASIHRAIKKFKPDILIPFSSDTTFVVTKYKKKYEKYCNIISLLDHAAFMQIHDKKQATLLLEKKGFAVPRSFFPSNTQELVSLIDRMSFPVIVKPRISSGSRGVYKANTKEELLLLFEKMHSQPTVPFDYEPSKVCIQEFIEGIFYTAYVLFKDGKAVFYFLAEVDKPCPKPFGPPTRSITVHNKKIKDLTLSLFTKLKWNGPANVHFIVDKKDGIPKIIEINPRIWATLESAIAADMDIHTKLIDSAYPGKIPYSDTYQKNQLFEWILFGSFYSYFRNNKKEKQFRVTKKMNEIALSDPLPHFVHLLDFILNKQIL